MNSMFHSRPLFILNALLVLIVAACAPTLAASESADSGSTDSAESNASAAGSQFAISDDGSSDTNSERQDFELIGAIEAFDSTGVTISGFSFLFSGDTVLDEGLAVGVIARVEYIILNDNSLLALSVETDADDSAVEDASQDGNAEDQDESDAGLEDEHFSGIIQSLSDTSVTIDGLVFIINADTVLDEGLEVGVLARVEYVQLADGSLLALEVETDAADDTDDEDDELEDEHINGIIQSLSTTSITINGVVFIINADTVLDEGLEVGVLARIEFVSLADGSLLALEVETDSDQDSDVDDDNDGDDDDDDEDNSGSNEHDEDNDNSGSGSSNSGSSNSGSSNDDDDDDDDD